MSSDSAAAAGQPHIEAHDPHHLPEPDLVDKGLQHDSVGLLASVLLSVSSVAPAYALTATLGLTVTEVGVQAPAIFLVGFVPMLLAASAYRELNKVAPDAGTSFTWTVKAFGPHAGWMCGWGLVVAIIIVLSNLAGVAVTFFYLFVAEVTGDPDIATWGDGKAANVATCLAFIAIATYVAYRGMTTTKSVMYVLVGIQMAALALFTVVAIVKALNGDASTAIDFEWSWLSPFSVTSFSVLATALSLSIFMYWGWDTALSANEETKGSERTPGLAALLSLLILSTYVLVTVAAQMFAGTGEEGVGLGNPETSDNVFAALADPVLGGTLSLLLFLAVLASSASSLQTTFIPGARTILAMSTYKALPDSLSAIHPKHRIPSYATLVCGIGTGVFYTVMTFVSENVLVDTILSLGLMICFYYGLTAFAAAWYFRRELTLGVGEFLLKGAAPVLGGLALAAVFVKLAIDTIDPDYGSGGSIFGIGTVFVLGIGALLLGVVVMFAWQRRSPEFFRSETLKHDTPALIVEDGAGNPG